MKNINHTGSDHLESLSKNGLTQSKRRQLKSEILSAAVALVCIFIGWIVKPKTIIDEVKLGGHKFGREKLYVIMVKYVTPVLLSILLLQALLDNGIDFVKQHVGAEATGKPFDAINAINTNEKALYSEHLNPMVNMGAIAMCTLIRGADYDERFERLLALTRQLAGNPSIQVDEAVYLSEKRTGNKKTA